MPLRIDPDTAIYSCVEQMQGRGVVTTRERHSRWKSGISNSRTARPSEQFRSLVAEKQTRAGYLTKAPVPALHTSHEHMAIREASGRGVISIRTAERSVLSAHDVRGSLGTGA